MNFSFGTPVVKRRLLDSYSTDMKQKERRMEDFYSEIQFLERFRIHPLLIDHVIESILDYLPEETCHLLKQRLVCRQWKDLASVKLSKSSNAILSFGKFKHPVETMRDFCILVQKSDFFPYTKFRLSQDIFGPKNEQDLKQFFEVCGHFMETLMIWLDFESTLDFSDADEIGSMSLMSSLSKLSSLKCLVYDDRRPGLINMETPANFNFLAALLKGSPRLEKLSVIFPPESRFDNGQSARIASNAMQILQQCSFRHLRQLKLDLAISDEFLTLLSEHIQNLHSVQLSFRSGILSKQCLTAFLQSQSDSLCHLRISDLCKRSHVTVEFPVLNNLASLEIHGWESVLTHVQMTPTMSYSKNFPRLKRLILNTWSRQPEWLSFFPSHLVEINAGMKVLKLPQEFDYPSVIEKISFSFPHLNRLELHYSWETTSVLRAVFIQLTTLQELQILQSFPGDFKVNNVDHIFTGLSITQCKKILKYKLYDFERANSSNQQTDASLRNLKNLKKLDIKDLHYQAIITDVTGYLVLLRMPKLKSLLMGRSYINDACLSQLALRFPETMKDQLRLGKIKKIEQEEHHLSDLPNKCSIA